MSDPDDLPFDPEDMGTRSGKGPAILSKLFGPRSQRRTDRQRQSDE